MTMFNHTSTVRELQNKIDQLRTIAEAAWGVRREQRDYTPCPDLALRANHQRHLHKLLDAWKAAEAAGDE